ncbi:nucleoside hydrolase [Vibrio sp. SCSIO 43136]|uniref:nucleoside hydrolase n=1 Tax=Vibrio sp. SCSIO 43136 TaxID=2819101 RepID=UPI00207635A0|nr:nucleoside hydrolase [Vibrio sp. SCSIO 43136]USD66144.1 nucleoside hydrolase [Vibrio sp. SCSIO 43136]
MWTTQPRNNSRNVKKALLVVTSHTELDGTDKHTGFWFDELATPFWGFYDAGYEVTIASIRGGLAKADPLSATGETVTPAVKRFQESAFAMGQLDNTVSVVEVDTSAYTTLFLCGGHGTLWDFRQSHGLARIVSEFYADKKLIGSVCHGPTGLLSAQKPDGTPLVAGLKLTAFSDAEEKLTPHQYIEALPYHLEDALVDKGACYQCEKPNAHFVVSEKGLITGQNPASVDLVVKTILDALEKTKVWVDTDISIGTQSESGVPCDVDDAYALLSLFNSTNVKVVGVSAVFGNTDVDTAYKLAKTMAKRFGPVALPVKKGAAAKLDVNEVKENKAVLALAEALRKQSMTIVSIGPATNIATLILLYPELAKQIDQVIFVAGRSSVKQSFVVGPKQEVPFRDLNFDLDPDAMKVLIESCVPVVLTPFELANQVWMTQSDLQTLGESSGAGKYLKKHTQPWLEMWENKFGAQGFNPFDALAAGFVENPNNYQWEKVAVEFPIAPDDTKAGRFSTGNSYKPYLVASHECQSANTVLMCTGVTPDFCSSLVSRITTPNDPSKYIAAVSHLNIVVDDVDKATAFYQRTLGFEQAYDESGEIMDYPHLTLASFAKDAGFEDGKVDVDIRFLHHPTAGLYLELMRYYEPMGEQRVTIKNTNDMGGIRHTALEVNDIMEAFNYLKDQPGVEIVRYPDGHEHDEVAGPPMLLSPFPMSFFYWRDPYGVQWEMECGRKRGYLRGI